MADFIMNCPVCGHQRSQGAKRCGACGERVAPDEVPLATIPVFLLLVVSGIVVFVTAIAAGFVMTSLRVAAPFLEITGNDTLVAVVASGAAGLLFAAWLAIDVVRRSQNWIARKTHLMGVAWLVLIGATALAYLPGMVLGVSLFAPQAWASLAGGVMGSTAAFFLFGVVLWAWTIQQVKELERLYREQLDET